MANQYIEEYLPINGKKQYMLHYPCAKKETPLVLFVGGGPGLAPSMLSYAFQGNLADSCTAVYWDLPGTGKTLAENPDFFPSMDDLLRDMFIVVSCLKIKYWKNKLILLGQDFGSVLCSLYALKHPDDVACLIGAGQLVGIMENEQAAYAILKGKLAANPAALKKLENIGSYPQRNLHKMLANVPKFRRLQSQNGMGVGFREIFNAVRKNPLCKWEDIKALIRGIRHNKPLWEFMLGHSLEMEIRPYKMPVYFLQGEQDFQVSKELTESYLQRLRSPQKEMISIPGARHYMMLDDPLAFRDALISIFGKVQELT